MFRFKWELDLEFFELFRWFFEHDLLGFFSYDALMPVEVDGLFFEQRVVSQFAGWGFFKEGREFLKSGGFVVEWEKFLFLFLADL